MTNKPLLNSWQHRGLAKVGDLYIPANSSQPGFSSSNAAARVDTVLSHTDPADLGSLRLLLAVVPFVPNFLLIKLLAKAEDSFLQQGRVASLLRELDFGLGGLIKTLYYADQQHHVDNVKASTSHPD